MTSLTAQIDGLRDGDRLGLVRMVQDQHDPFSRWLFTAATAGFADDLPPELSPAGWQTHELREGLWLAGVLVQLFRQQGLWQSRVLLSAAVDVLLIELQERGECTR